MSGFKRSWKDAMVEIQVGDSGDDNWKLPDKLFHVCYLNENE